MSEEMTADEIIRYMELSRPSAPVPGSEAWILVDEIRALRLEVAALSAALPVNV